ncbi:DUF397 domain-containing protein [Embleya hyalina]|uniref:DUF397 domain-containing protein n=1 Tax=Embleya hyalina TaxID=516124 RepID=UPI000F8436B9
MSTEPTYSWRRSSWSQHNQDCVEIAPLPTTTAVRDTKARARGHLELGPTAWLDLLRALKS